MTLGSNAHVNLSTAANKFYSLRGLQDKIEMLLVTFYLYWNEPLSTTAQLAF